MSRQEAFEWDVLRTQYAAVGAAARADLKLTVAELERANGNGVDVTEWLERAELYGAAYRGHCWPVNGVTDLKLAPFHLLATEGAARRHAVSYARRPVAYFAGEYLGRSPSEIAQATGVSRPATTKAIARGEELARELELTWERFFELEE